MHYQLQAVINGKVILLVVLKTVILGPTPQYASLICYIIRVSVKCIILISISSAQIANGGGSTAEESNIVENIDANDSASVPSNGLNVVGSRVPARDEIYENVNVVISTEGEGTSSKPADGVYVDTVISSAPDSYYESLTYPDGDTPAGGAHQSDQQSRSSSAKTVGNGVEEVPEVTVTSNEDSEDDELYLALDQLKQGKCELTPADSAVLEDSYWYQPGIPR